MIDVTSDPEADAVYFRMGQGRIDSTEEAGPLVYDLDAEGRILGIEVIGATRSSLSALGETPGFRDCRRRMQQSEID